MPIYCATCKTECEQVFPCFACMVLFCEEHVFEHTCSPSVSRNRLSIMQDPVHTDSSTALGTLNPKASTAGWSSDHAELSGAHHIFPKSTLVWIFEHMSEGQQAVIRRLLMLPSNAGGLALTRLRSNLISPRHGGQEIRPEKRRDDPHHHGGSGLIGEENLDLVRTTSGLLEPRSLRYRQLAWYVSQVVAPRFERNRDDFELNDEEATIIVSLILSAEMIHYHLEQDPQMPSFQGNSFWQERDGRFKKGVVEPTAVAPFTTVQRNYRRLKGREVRQQQQRYMALRMEREQSVNYPRSGEDSFAFKSQRLGGFGKPPNPSKGTRGWLLQQFTTQLEIDIASALDIMSFGLGGRRRWKAGIVALIKKIAGSLNIDYRTLRQQANDEYRNGDRAAFMFLPQVMVEMTPWMIAVRLNNAFARDDDRFVEGNYEVLIDLEWIERELE